MSDNQTPKKSKSKLLIIVLIVVLIASGGVGYFLYEKGQQDMQDKLKLEQFQKEMNEKNRKRMAELKEIIAQRKSDLQIASEKLSSISEFQFLRTADEKRQQLAEQNKLIDALKEDISRLQNELNSLQQVTY